MIVGKYRKVYRVFYSIGICQTDSNRPESFTRRQGWECDRIRNGKYSGCRIEFQDQTAQGILGKIGDHEGILDLSVQAIDAVVEDQDAIGLPGTIEN